MDYGVFNAGGGHAYTVKEFAEIVKREVEIRKNDTLPEPEVPGLYRFGDTRNACSDISKIRELGWEPQNTPIESVKDYVAWLYEQDSVEDIMEYAMKTMKKLNVIRSADLSASGGLKQITSADYAD